MPDFAEIPISKAKRGVIYPSEFFHTIPMTYKNFTSGHRLTAKEYKEYFVSGIVSMPETLSVQPTDNSFGSNTDFGYAYAPVRLLKNEYDKKYSEVKDELDEKQSELDTEWNKAQKELDDAEQKLNDAKKQLAEKEKLFEDS